MFRYWNVMQLRRSSLVLGVRNTDAPVRNLPVMRMAVETVDRLHGYPGRPYQ